MDRADIPLPLLAATTALTGALIMVVEVMGSKVIGPFFGVSLFVWTALITVTPGDLASALVLTDHYNPIDFFDRELKELLRSEILLGSDWRALL